MFSCRNIVELQCILLLIPIADVINCTTNIPVNGFVIEGMYYAIDCIISFSGIGPNITWTGPPETTGVPWNQGTSYTNNLVWAGVNLNMSRFFGGYSFSAAVNYRGPGFVGVPNQASNIPTYAETISWPTFYVRCEWKSALISSNLFRLLATAESAYWLTRATHLGCGPLRVSLLVKMTFAGTVLNTAIRQYSRFLLGKIELLFEVNIVKNL